MNSPAQNNPLPSATDDFNHGVVLSGRPLRSNEVFQVRIDKMVDKWAGSIEIGVTTHNPAYLQLPSTMTNLRSGKVPCSVKAVCFFLSVFSEIPDGKARCSKRCISVLLCKCGGGLFVFLQ